MKKNKQTEKSKKLNEKELPLDKLPEIIKDVHKKGTQSKDKTEKKIFLLGFMPPAEINGLVQNDLEESFDFDRVKKLWLPKSKKMNELMNSDKQLLNEQRMNEFVKDIDPKYESKTKEIETKLSTSPFWKANKPSIKMIKIDELIVLQNSVNLERVKNLSEHIYKNTSVEKLFDYSFDFNRKSAHINHHLISNNAMLFSTDDDDVRPGKIEVRTLPKYDGTECAEGDVPTLVFPIVQGEPFVQCVRTFTTVVNRLGVQQRVYFLTLQNGIHRAYALRSIGIEYMPCLVVDPETSGETDFLLGNWTPQRRQQGILMKDFFNPELVGEFAVRKRLRCVKIEWKIENFTT